MVFVLKNKTINFQDLETKFLNFKTEKDQWCCKKQKIIELNEKSIR